MSGEGDREAGIRGNIGEIAISSERSDDMGDIAMKNGNLLRRDK